MPGPDLSAIRRNLPEIIFHDLKIHFTRLHFLKTQNIIDQPAQPINIPSGDTKHIFLLSANLPHHAIQEDIHRFPDHGQRIT